MEKRRLLECLSSEQHAVRDLGARLRASFVSSAPWAAERAAAAAEQRSVDQEIDIRQLRVASGMVRTEALSLPLSQEEEAGSEAEEVGPSPYPGLAGQAAAARPPSARAPAPLAHWPGQSVAHEEAGVATRRSTRPRTRGSTVEAPPHGLRGRGGPRPWRTGISLRGRWRPTTSRQLQAGGCASCRRV